MELRYLRYFVAVARTRHFTQAAKELGISQPPLSQQIQRLEREVGTPLFRRLTRGVELTEAGESFYEDARQILAMSDAALEKAKGIARGMNGSLSLGITSSDAFHPQIFTLLHRFQLDHPGVTLHQMEDNMANLMTALSEAELDIAFVRLPCESSKAFNLRIIDEEPMVIALPRDNPLATQPTPPWSSCATWRRSSSRGRWPRGCMSWCTTAACAPASIWSAPGSRRRFRHR